MERQRRLLMEKQPSLYSSDEFSVKLQKSLPRPPRPSSCKRYASPAESRCSESLPEEPFRAPIISSRDWNLRELLKKGPRFKEVPRISALKPYEELLHAIEAYEASDEPLIIEGWHQHPAWPKDLFDIDKLVDKCGTQTWSVRNVRDYSDRNVTLADFIAWSRRSANDISRSADELLYGKDAPCPPEWREWVDGGNVLPPVLCPNGPGDLFQHLQASEGVESLMCYFGIGDTFTPCHKDLCASSGHNIMCYTENGGSSFWFMTASSDAPAVGAYFQKDIGQELDWEAYAATVNEFAQAPFTVYVAEQKLGDLVLVPPRSCHQVVNHGGLTVKTSWSRMTVQGLSIALYHELPIYRRVCRPEQYRVKQILFCSLIKYSAQLKRLPSDSSARATTQEKFRIKIASDLAKLVDLFDFVMEAEFTEGHEKLDTIVTPEQSQDPVERKFRQNFRRSERKEPPPDAPASSTAKAPASCNLACDFCGADIFQSFFECNNRCREEFLDGSIAGRNIGDGLLICPSCYVEGRTCACQEMRPLQCRPILGLLEERNQAAYLLCTRIAEEQYMRVQVSGRELLTQKRNLRVFEAGCKLVKLRQQDKAIKCRCGHTGLARAEVYNCTECHGSKCAKHLLDCGIHSAEAILEFVPGDPKWHEFHKKKAVDFKSSIAAFDEAERKGDVISYRDRLVLVARRYKSCRPLNPRGTHRGWYDDPIEPIHRPKNSKNAQEPDSHSRQAVHSHAAEDTSDASYLPEIRIAAHETRESSDHRDFKRGSPSDVGSVSPLSSLTASPAPITISSPAHLPHVPEPLGGVKRRFMSVKVVIPSRPPPKSTAPPSGTMAKRPPARVPAICRPEDDYTSELVKVTNSANRDEPSTPPSEARVRSGRIESPPESPILTESTLSPLDDEPPPRKKQKVSKDPVAPPSPTMRRTVSTSSRSLKQRADPASDSIRKARSGLPDATRFGPPKPKKGPPNSAVVSSQHASVADCMDTSQSVVTRKPDSDQQQQEVEKDVEAVPATASAAAPAASTPSASTSPNQAGNSLSSHISSSTQLTVHSFPPTLQMPVEGLTELIQQVVTGLSPHLYTQLGGLERALMERTNEIKALKDEMVGLRDEVRDMRRLREEVKQLRLSKAEIKQVVHLKEEFQAYKTQTSGQIKALQATIEKLSQDTSKKADSAPQQNGQPPTLPHPPPIVPPPSAMQQVPPPQVPPQQIGYPPIPFPFPQPGVPPNTQYAMPPQQFYPNYGHNHHHNGAPTNYRGSRGRPNYRPQNRPWQNNNPPYDRSQQNDRQPNDDDYYNRGNHARDDHEERQSTRRHDSSARQDRESLQREDSGRRHSERDLSTRAPRDGPSRQRDELRHAGESDGQHDVRRGRQPEREAGRREESADGSTSGRSPSRSPTPSHRTRFRSPSEVPAPHRRSPSVYTSVSLDQSPGPEQSSSSHNEQQSPDIPRTQSPSPDTQ